MLTGSRSYILGCAVARWVTLRATLLTQFSRDLCLFGPEKDWTAPPSTRDSNDYCTPIRSRAILFAGPVKHVALARCAPCPGPYEAPPPPSLVPLWDVRSN